MEMLRRMWEFECRTHERIMLQRISHARLRVEVTRRGRLASADSGFARKRLCAWPPVHLRVAAGAFQ